MSTIRPDLPLASPQTQGVPPGARAAQAAFFRAAMAGAEAVQPRPQPVQTMTAQTSEPEATRAVRPGSLLDIRV